MNDSDAMLLEAKAASDEKNEPKAQGILLELLRAEPHNSAALYMLGGSYFCEEKYPEAAVVFEQLVLMFPGDGKVSTGLYNAHWSQGNHMEAVAEIKRFFENADPSIEQDAIRNYKRIIETLSAEDKAPPN
jgi:tetratricopeptide (TPR) repeat protein